jgi:hypothetical protein
MQESWHNVFKPLISRGDIDFPFVHDHVVRLFFCHALRSYTNKTVRMWGSLCPEDKMITYMYNFYFFNIFSNFHIICVVVVVVWGYSCIICIQHKWYWGIIIHCLNNFALQSNLYKRKLLRNVRIDLFDT